MGGWDVLQIGASWTRNARLRSYDSHSVVGTNFKDIRKLFKVVWKNNDQPEVNRMENLKHLGEVRKVFRGQEGLRKRDVVRLLKELGVPQSSAYDIIRALTTGGGLPLPRLESRDGLLRLIDRKGVEEEAYRADASACADVLRETFGLNNTEGVEPSTVNEQKTDYYLSSLGDLIMKRRVTDSDVAKTLVSALLGDISTEHKVTLSGLLLRLLGNANAVDDNATVLVLRGAVQEREGAGRMDLMTMAADPSENVDVRRNVLMLLKDLDDERCLCLSLVERIGPLGESDADLKVLDCLKQLVQQCHRINRFRSERMLIKLLDHEDEPMRRWASWLLKQLPK